MTLNVYLNFNGNCREAVDFYAKAFDTEKQQILTFTDIPHEPEFPLPEDAGNLIMHTYLNIAGNKIMFSDILPGMSFNVGNNINLTLVINNMDEIKSLFNKLKEDGTVEMELQETSWSKCYGSLTDKFGIPWQLSLSD
ncbi:MAG: glyoxalase family protein [Clostridia bacterium]|nr:glyoxalase family protein [Clostridia bacterium]